MKKCSSCGAEIDENSTFCPVCGNKQETNLQSEITCPKCGFKNESVNKFCQKCGTKLISNDQSDNDSTKTITYTYCPKCGFKNESVNKFCQKCGNPLDIKSESKNQNEFNNNQSQVRTAYNESGNPGFSNSLKIWDKYLKLRRETSKDEVLKYCMGRADYWYIMLPIASIVFIIGGYILSDASIIMDVILIRYCTIPTMNRLHDAGYSGKQAYLFIPIVVADAYQIVAQLSLKTDLDKHPTNLYILLNVVSLICVIILIFYLCKKTNWTEKRWIRN